MSASARAVSSPFFWFSGLRRGEGGRRDRAPGAGRGVLGCDLCREAADAFLAGPVRQQPHQLGAKAAPLPVVDDSDGDIGGLRVIGAPDVAGDAHAAPAGVIQRADRLVVVVVDLGEVAQLRRGVSSPFPDRNRDLRDLSLNRAKPSARSGASSLRTGRISTCDPSRSKTGDCRQLRGRAAASPRPSGAVSGGRNLLDRPRCQRAAGAAALAWPGGRPPPPPESCCAARAPSRFECVD